MSFEVEIKYRADNHDDLVERLLALGAVAGPETVQEDDYLAHPVRDFGKTNEALRIRRIGSSNMITYKGPRLAGPTKTREEIEIHFSDGLAVFEQMIGLFTKLGFTNVATVRKTRRPFHLEYQGSAMEVALDNAEKVGRFAEVEAIADNEAGLADAQAAVMALAERLALDQVEPRSYLRMTLVALGKSS